MIYHIICILMSNCIENIDDLEEFYKEYKSHYQKIKNLKKKHGIKFRNSNFPEILSENLCKFAIKYIENKNCINAKKGDLVICENKKILPIEIKCFSSNGPSSFGPNEKWYNLYFIDTTNMFLTDKFIIYKINLSNDSKEWSNIKINKSKNYSDVCKLGKRPRIPFEKIKEQIPKNIKIIFEGTIIKLKNISKVKSNTNNLSFSSVKDITEGIKNINLDV